MSNDGVTRHNGRGPSAAVLHLDRGVLSMAARRAISLDGFAAGFLVVSAVLAVSLLSDDPATGSNWLGEAGSGLAGALTDALGAAAYLTAVTVSLLTLDLALWRCVPRFLRRAAGWTAVVACAAIIIDRTEPVGLDGFVSGPGGTVGAWLSEWLDSACSPPWQVLLLSVFSGLGVLLAADYAVLPVLRLTLGCMRITWKASRAAGGLASWQRAATEAPVQQRPPAGDDAIPIIRPTAALGPDLKQTPLVEETEPAPVPAVEKLPLRIVRPGPVPDAERFQNYELPPLELLEDPLPFPYEEHDQHLRDTAALLEKTFNDFALNVHVVGINTGPVITQYEVALETGLRVNKVTRLSEDLALNLKVPSVRIVAPIPGKNTVGIEIPNEHRAIVRLKEVLLATGKWVVKSRIPLFLGKDTEGRPLMYDLAEMPHLLIAGRTGTGKSVCLNAIILSMLMTRRPDELKLILIDPKRTELIEYSRLPHLMHPVVTDAKKAEAILAWAVDKMEERYDLLSRCRVRSIAAYNELGASEIMRRLQPADEVERSRIPVRMPYVVLIVDELGDLMMQMKREIEGHIIRLAQKSRAAGIHLVVATQKPTVDVITGLIKSNLPARICFQVSSRSDSRVVLDEMGADKLLGKGDMLFLQPGTGVLVRAQGAYAGDQEITSVVEHLDCDPQFAQELLELKTTSEEDDGDGGAPGFLKSRDPVYEQAIAVVVREGRGSVSLLQRALGIGYGRAARLIDFMAEDGIVGSYNGSNAREVLYTPEQWQAFKQNAAS
jgi:S-DNA-T family DNA segregation ATPase FtsK/SpoIIIE